MILPLVNLLLAISCAFTHVQALRHLYVIAVEERCLHAVDVDTGLSTPVDVEVRVSLCVCATFCVYLCDSIYAEHYLCGMV